MSSGPSADGSPLHDLDDVVHQRVRLAILALLSQVDALEFTRVRDELGATDGNLNRHLRALDDAGYVNQSRESRRGKSSTWLSITAAGSLALSREVAALRALLDHID
ncbi:MAG: transcriptional regulator [Actinomycetales bacterium]